ncbi:MAG TPA: hypothetical protein VNK43_05130 [Gemmatimonadales bacterium]|nr:hypothetical protein [Gemmatimonadales bacterium]
MPDANLPARFDRAALERIIRRAAELQTGDREVGENLTAEEVLALGKEVGIPTHYLRQAMLEERTRVAAARPAGLLDRMAGPPMLETRRVVMASVEEVERRLLRYMTEHELLTVQRHQPGRISWEPLSGFQAAIRRSTAALGGGRRPFMLSKADRVIAVITPLEEGYAHVSLAASVRRARTARLGGAGASASLGVAASAVLLALGAFEPVALAPLPMSVGLGYGILRQHRPADERVLLGLECALDHVEQGSARPSHTPAEGTPGVMGLIAREIRKALR